MHIPVEIAGAGHDPPLQGLFLHPTTGWKGNFLKFNQYFIAKFSGVCYCFLVATEHFQEELTMTIGNVIATYRKNMGLTQDGLAQQLGVTNQAVSKWESDQSCPDILLLPKIADIFGITIDELFGREKPQAEPVELIPAPVVEVNDLPWPDDDTLHVAIYKGHTYLASCPEQEKITFEYEGPVLNIDCAVNLNCEDVAGDVRANGNVNCDAVEGNVQARGNVACDAVEGNVTTEGNVNCDDVAGHVSAGGSVTCDSVEGNVNAGGNVTCDEVEGSVYAGGNVICDEISGNVTAGGTVTTGEDGPGNFHFSMGGKGKKKGRIHITVNDDDDIEEDAADEEDFGEKIESRIEKFVNDIIRKSTNFRP